MDADSAWDRLVAESGDDVDIATMVAQSNIEDAQKALDKAKKQTPKLVGTTEEKLATAKAFKELVVKAQNDLAKWQAIANEPNRRASLQTEQTESQTDLQTESQGQQVADKLPASEEVTTETPTESESTPQVGLVEDARTRTLGDKTRKMLDAMAKRLGLQVEFVDEIVTGKDEKGHNLYANAVIVGKNVKIAWHNRNRAIDFLLGHEFTHRMQDLSPEAYAEFVEAAKQALGEKEWGKRINRMKSLYKQHGIAISEQGIIDEVVADYAGELVEERGVFDNFVERNKSNRSLLSKIADVLRSIKEFFTLGKQRKINNAIARLEALIESASEANVDKVDMAVNKAIEQSGKVRFSAQELQQIEDANAKFNEELIDFGEKKHVGLLHLGKPMKILQVSGVNVEEMTISPSVLYKHLKQHNLVTDDLLDLARAVQFPILVYKHGESHPNIVVVTELDVKGGKLSIALKLDENGEVVEVSNVSSVHSKDALTELSRLSLLEDDVLRNNLRWVEKEKVSDWLGLPYEEERQANPKLDSVAKIINEFENPTISEEKNEEKSAKAQYSLQGNSMTEEEQRIADEAKANGTFDASNPDIRYSLATDLNAEVSEGEANPIAEKEVVNVIVDSSEIKLPTNRAEALDVVSKMKRPFINHDQNKEIIVSNKAVRHAATQDKMHKFVDVRCLGVIDKIIENAVKIGNIDVAPDEIETTHKVEVYYCPVKIDDTQYSVRILVRQLKNKGRIMEDFRMYDLAAKDKKSDVSSQGTGNESLTPLLTSDFAYKVKDLIHNSKEQDKKLLGISNKTKFSLQGGRSIADKYEKRVNTKGKGGAMHLSKFNFMEAWQD